MSIANDEHLLKNFNKFYRMMLPQMTGAPVLTGFNKSDIYSEEEQMVGQWVDGKPIYQRTISFTTSSSTPSDWVSVPIDTTSYNINTLVNIYMDNLIYRDNQLGLNCEMEFKILSSQIQYYYIQAWMNNCPITITIQYTKTTDTAMRIGTISDFSSKESVVGTFSGVNVYKVSRILTNVELYSGYPLMPFVSPVAKVLQVYGSVTVDGRQIQIPSSFNIPALSCEGIISTYLDMEDNTLKLSCSAILNDTPQEIRYQDCSVVVTALYIYSDLIGMDLEFSVIKDTWLVPLTQQEYDNLPAAQKNNGLFYLVNDSTNQ